MNPMKEMESVGSTHTRSTTYRGMRNILFPELGRAPWVRGMEEDAAGLQQLYKAKIMQRLKDLEKRGIAAADNAQLEMNSTDAPVCLYKCGC